MSTQTEPARSARRSAHFSPGRATRDPPRDQLRGVATFLLAGGEGRRLLPLTLDVPKPAVAFGPDGRIIDFALENCLAAGIALVAVLTQHEPDPLEDYLARRFSSRFRRLGGALALVRAGTASIPRYHGNADAILEGLDALGSGFDTLLVLAADHVYRMDYEAFVGAHRGARAALTIGAVPVSIADASRFGVIEASEGGRVRRFVEKPAAPHADPREPGTALASMGIYVIDREALALARAQIGRTGGVDFGRDVVPAILSSGADVRVFRHSGATTHSRSCRRAALPTMSPGAWFDVGTPEALLAASLAVYPEGAAARTVIVHPEATVSRSILRAGAVVEAGARVEESILLEGAVVGAGAHVRRVVLGAGVRIPACAVATPLVEGRDRVLVIARSCCAGDVESATAARVGL